MALRLRSMTSHLCRAKLSGSVIRLWSCSSKSSGSDDILWWKSSRLQLVSLMTKELHKKKTTW